MKDDTERILEASPYLREKHKVKITILKVFDPSEVFESSPVTHVEPYGPCRVVKEGDEFIVDESSRMPEGFCPQAYQNLWEQIRTLQFGGDFPYYKEKGMVISCCTDGLRPVIFKLERV
jgi:uncharacterized repeat protein (TIGR04076 family)